MYVKVDSWVGLIQHQNRGKARFKKKILFDLYCIFALMKVRLISNLSTWAINKWDTKEKYSKLLVFTYRRSRQNVWKYDKRHINIGPPSINNDITYWNSQLIYKLANTCRHNDVTAGICRKQSFTYKGMRQVLNISTWAYSETHTNNISIKKAVFHL